MTRFFLILTLCLLPCTLQAQDTPPKQDVAEQVSRNPFRQALLKAADAAAKKGELRRLDVVRLRVATLSPAFLERAQELAVIQMASSGEDLGDLPTDADGKIEVSRIDWENFLAFLEALLPIILKIIDMFAMSGHVGFALV
jgi:phosphoglycerate dehydrogenase-like enzyme